MNRISFEVEGVNYDVRRPKPEEDVKAQAVYNKKFSEALKNDALLRDALLDHMTKQGLWSSEIEKEIEGLRQLIANDRDRIKAANMKKSEGLEISKRIRGNLDRLTYLNRHQNRLDKLTADAQAEQARFEYLVSACTVDSKTGKQVYKDLNDYLDKASKAEDELSYKASMNMMYLLANVDPDAEGQTEENKFLRRFGYVDEKLRYIDKNGKLIDADGRHIDEQGRLIKWNEDFTKSELIDFDGKLVDEKGEPLIQEGEWYDD